jgi:hypothetical protein
MKTHLKLVCAAALMGALCAGFAACRDDGGPTDEEALKKAFEEAPVKLVDKEALPKWLGDKLDLYIATTKDLAISHFRVYKGELSGKMVYNIHDGLSSCWGCDAYDENGGQLSGLTLKDVREWVLIWEYWPLADTRDGSVYGGEAIVDE